MKCGKFISAVTALALTLGVCQTVMPVTTNVASAAGSATVVRLDPSEASPFNDGKFEGWGTSMGWWGNRIGYSDTMAQQAAHDLYSEEGLGLDIVRYNVGGGDNPTHNHINRSDSKLPCFAVPQYDGDSYVASGENTNVTNLKKDENGDVVYTWDWDADHNQVNVLTKIKAQNPDVHIEGYTNSPPWFMTESQCSSGGIQTGWNGSTRVVDENLDPSNYDVFAKFLVEVTKHMDEEGLHFDSYSPMNEPNPKSGYWFALSDKQEGNLVAQGEHQSALIKALKDAYKAANINTLVAGPDETDLGYTVSSVNALTDEGKAALDRIDTHTYGGSNRAGVKQTAIDAGKNLWMSEVDGGWNGFGLADRIIADLNGMQASAWVMWDIIDSHRDANFVDPTTGNHTEANRSLDVTGSLWGVGMGNHDTEKIEWANKYYAYGQFTRYINPGDTLIASSNSTLAAYNKETGAIKVVVNNSGSSDIPYEIDMSAFTSIGDTVTEIRSNNATGASAEHWKPITGEATLNGKMLETTAKAGTITTYVIDGPEGFEDKYAIIKGGDDNLLIGGKIQMTLNTNIVGTPTWSVSEDVASIDSGSGELTINKSGTVTVSAEIGGFTTSKDITVPFDISSSKTQLSVGDKITLSCNVAEGYSGTVTWSVLPAEAAEINSETGELTAVGPGTATVTVTAKDSTGAYTSTATKEFKINEYTLSGSASWNNVDSTDYRMATDGSFDTYFDGLTNGWVMYDYGKPYKVSEIKLAARGGGDTYAARTVGGEVQASNDGINWTTLYKITSALSATAYTTLTADQLGLSGDKKAYRYYRYTNSDHEANISEFIITGTPSDNNNIPEGDPTVKDIAEFTDNFEGNENIFDAAAGDLTANGNQIFASGLERFGNVFVPVKDTGKSELSEAITLTDKDRFRMSLNMFSGWEDKGAANTFALKDAEGNEVVALKLTGGGYTLEELRIGGTNILSGKTDGSAQCKNSASKGANGWDHSQRYQNNVGYNKTLEILIDGTGTVKVSFTGGNTANTTVEGAIDVSEKEITIGSIELTGDYNAARGRTVSYDNLDGDLITYSTKLPDPTEPPEIPDDGTLISLDFNNGDLTSGSKYGKATGTPTFVEVDGRQAAQLTNSDATVITLTDANGNGLLAGQEEITVSFSFKQTGDATSWWFFAAPNDNEQKYEQEHYLGAFGSAGNLKVERYNNSGSRPTANEDAFNKDAWNDVIISYGADTTKVYINNHLMSTVPSSCALKDILGTNPVAYIGRANWGANHEFATGYIDDFVIKQGAYKTVLDSIDLGDTSAVKDDITIPNIDGVTWESSDPDVVGANGKVTRQDDTVTVTLTAKDGGNTRKFEVTVIGLTAFADTFTAYNDNGSIKFTADEEEDNPYTNIVALYKEDGTLVSVKTGEYTGNFDDVADGTYKVNFFLWDSVKGMEPKHDKVTKTVVVKDELQTAAYLFAHFVGTQEDATKEQMYFSVSTDGTTWKTLNGGKPVLTSTVGTQGVRDPYILRGEDGKFYIIATDLSIFHNNNWTAAAQQGSKNIVVWESDDLVNWGNASLVKVGGDNAGCVWAPEAVYDREEGKYMVFWASVISDDNFAKYRIFRSYTSDFTNFTDPEIYIEEPNAVIDTTIVEDKGVYYRFTKNETNTTITMQACTSLNGNWKDVETYTINGVAGNTVTGYEGPTIYKDNGSDSWTLLLDYFSKSQGYKPFVTSDLSTGVFTSGSDFTFDATYRHGTVMPITQAEYEALVEKYPNS